MYLFSGGQDSLIFFYLFSCQKTKEKLNLLLINHCEQVNCYLLVIFSIRFATIFQQMFLTSTFSYVKYKNSPLSENNFRFGRYTLSKRLTNFYEAKYLLTGHTNSDLFETQIIQFGQKCLEGFNLQESSTTRKNLVKKQYFNNYSTKLNKTVKRSKKKFYKNFKINFSTTIKKPILLTRLLQEIERKTIFEIFDNYSLPIFIELTNFDSSNLRNQIRYAILSLFSNFQELIKLY